jgi:3-methyladenine DNA glycosylase AlkD
MQKFFRTGPGEYGEGDRLLGLTVPEVRGIARQFCALTITDAERALRSPWHEERLFALLVLMRHYARGTADDRERVFRLYVRRRRYVNNWDLVDLSAGAIVGAHLHGRSARLLDTLARSKSLWDRRIAMVATQYDIRRQRYDRALRIASVLVDDRHDLIHKAVGWMLREVGNRDREAEERFLDVHAPHMPRTMLRYAIEKFPEGRRRYYLEAASRRAGK